MIVEMGVNDDMFVSRAAVLVNPVNCVGVMGGGLAAEFRRRWPRMNGVYEQACAAGALHVGELFVWDCWPDEPLVAPHFIVNLPTKDHYANPSTIEYVTQGVQGLEAWLVGRLHEGVTIMSVAIPALGCGLGGLEWDDVRPVIEQQFEAAAFDDVQIMLYPPKPTKERR